MFRVECFRDLLTQCSQSQLDLHNSLTPLVYFRTKKPLFPACSHVWPPLQDGPRVFVRTMIEWRTGTRYLGLSFTSLLPLSDLGKLHIFPEPYRHTEDTGRIQGKKIYKKNTWEKWEPTRQGVAVLLLVKECFIFTDHRVTR